MLSIAKQNGKLLKFHPACLLFFNRYSQRNHYEILELQKDCTNKEIRDSFVKLSKEHHPDISKTENTAKFRKIMNAYKVLSRPESRARYDNELHELDHMNESYSRTGYGVYTTTSDRPPQGDPDSYYGIKGIRKISNWKIVCICIGFAALGVAFQAWAIIKSLTFSRRRLDFLSTEAGREHSNVRSEALKYSNAEQIERIKARLNYNDGEDKTQISQHAAKTEQLEKFKANDVKLNSEQAVKELKI